LVARVDASGRELGFDENHRGIQMSEQLNNIHKADNEEEIDLREIWRVLVKYKRMILLATFGTAIVAAGISLLLPNIYRAEVILAPTAAGDQKGDGIGKALGSFGGLASLAGVSLGGGGSNEENLAVLKSRDFLWKFVQEKKLMPILFEDKWDKAANRWKESDPKKQPGQLTVHRLFVKKGLMSVETEKKTSLITVSIEWEDPKLASEWANSLIEYLNQYLAERSIQRSERNLKYLKEALMKEQIEEFRKSLLDLIAQDTKNAMLSTAQKEFGFKVIDPAIEPDKKVKPQRAIIVVLAAVLASLIAMLVAFLKSRRTT
jgi:uncharacterized protein involved in exopolysaccharide biosynthesis